MAAVVLLQLIKTTTNMTDLRFLQTIYQQWAHGQSNAQARWLDFVELASRQTGVAQDQLMRELQKCYWFKWGEQ